MDESEPGLRQRPYLGGIAPPYFAIGGTDIKFLVVHGIRNPKNLFDVFGDLAKALFALAQGRLFQLSRADIAKGNNRSRQRVVLENGSTLVFHRKARAVGAPK